MSSDIMNIALKKQRLLHIICLKVKTQLYKLLTADSWKGSAARCSFKFALSLNVQMYTYKAEGGFQK